MRPNYLFRPTNKSFLTLDHRSSADKTSTTRLSKTSRRRCNPTRAQHRMHVHPINFRRLQTRRKIGRLSVHNPLTHPTLRLPKRTLRALSRGRHPLPIPHQCRPRPVTRQPRTVRIRIRSPSENMFIQTPRRETPTRARENRANQLTRHPPRAW